MANKQLPSAQVEQIQSLLARGFSRDTIANSVGVSERQVLNVKRGGVSPESYARKNAQQHYTAGTKSIRESYKANATRQGISTKIRGNEDYQRFKQQMEKQDKIYAQVENGMMTRKEWVTGRLDIYLKNGLITQAQYDAYILGVK